MENFWNDYTRDALVTVVNVDGIGGDRAPALVYRTLGLCGEIAELAESKFCRHLTTAERGDCLWYLAMIADELGIPLDTLEPGDKNAVVATLSLGNVVKKIYRDDNGVVTPDRFAKIKYLLGCVFHGLGDQTMLQEAATANIKKLHSRLERNALHGDGDNR